MRGRSLSWLMPCEMCGKEAPLKKAMIEGTEMRVCSDCADYGHEVTEAEEVTGRSKVAEGIKNRKKQQQKKKQRDVYDDHQEVLAEDYGDRVRKAREKKGFTVKELSDEINEKRSTVSKTEAHDHHPSDELVTKLERKLDITLMVKPESPQKVGGSSSSSSSGPMTLGDMLKEQMDEDEEE